MLFNNPISPERFDRLLAELPLKPGSRILDVGCGQGELMLRLLRTWGCQAVGIDTDAKELGIARTKLAEFGDAVTLYDKPFQKLQFMGLRFDAGFCIGATFACGRRGEAFAGAVTGLRDLATAGGLIVIGDGYWRQPPAPEYLAATGIEEREFKTYDECIAMGEDAGLQCIYATRASQEEWDHFEGSFWISSERELVQAPDDPDLVMKVERRRGWKKSYLRWGRDTLGFGLFVFIVPGDAPPGAP